MNKAHGEYRRHPRIEIRTDITLDMDIKASGLPEDLVLIRAQETRPITPSKDAKLLQNTQIEVKTRDVSASGLAIEAPKGVDLEPGQVVNLVFPQMNNRVVAARIVRVDDDSLGLQLEQSRLADEDLENIIDTAPWLQRLRVNLRRAVWKYGRRVGVFAINTVLRRPLLALIRPTFLFAVYGNERDVGTYYTPAMLRWMPPLIIGGYIRNGRHRGLLIGSQFLEGELAQDSAKVTQYLDDMRAEFGHVPRIALVGRLPNFVMKAGHAIKPPYVDGSMGTRFMIWDVARQMRQRPEYLDQDSVVVLGGAGRIGSRICEDLARDFSEVVAFDPRYEVDERTPLGRGTILYTANPAWLRQHKLFIGLTHHGDVIRNLKAFLPEGALIADDTHPCISQAVREELAAVGVSVEKIVLSHDEFSMTPRMPSWNNRDIPGCLVEALVLLEEADADVSDFHQFKATAERVGYRGHLVKPLDE